MALLKEESYTIEDIYALPDGERAELIDGHIYYMAPPSYKHQKLVMELSAIIRNYIKQHKGTCEVLPAPFAVYLDEINNTYVEPDISVICDPNKLDDKGCKGAPDWIIEIVSPASRKMDYLLKLFKYRSAGVREYVPGDPLHRMNWKASAHAGTLLMRREEHTAQQTVTVLLALESHSPDSGIMTQDEALLEHTIRVCAQCLWEFFRNGWQVRLCIGERRKDGLPIMSPYGGGSGMYHQLMQQLALLRLQEIVPQSQMLSMHGRSSIQETLLLITPYTDRTTAQWKQHCGGLVLVTGHAHDGGSCADARIPLPEYLHSEEVAS